MQKLPIEGKWSAVFRWISEAPSRVAALGPVTCFLVGRPVGGSPVTCVLAGGPVGVGPRTCILAGGPVGVGPVTCTGWGSGGPVGGGPVTFIL